MADRGIRTFTVHFGGKWSGKRYVGGNTIKIPDVDGDELCFIDLSKEIGEKTGLVEFRIKYHKEGSLAFVCGDSDVLDMWDQIKAVKGLYHLYVEESSGPNTPSDSIPNKFPPTPTKKPSQKNPEPLRKSPRFKKSPKSTKIKFGEKVRKSPRLASKWQSKFTSKAPLVISDDEEEQGATENLGEASSIPVPDLNKEAANNDDDWAIRHLIQTTCAEIEGLDIDWDFYADEKTEKSQPTQPEGEHSQSLVLHSNFEPLVVIPPKQPLLLPNPLHVEEVEVLSQCNLLGFDEGFHKVNDAEEEYHSDPDSVDEDYFGGAAEFNTDFGHEDGDAAEEGLKEGLNEGLKEGLNEGLNEGLKEGLNDADDSDDDSTDEEGVDDEGHVDGGAAECTNEEGVDDEECNQGAGLGKGKEHVHNHSKGEFADFIAATSNLYDSDEDKHGLPDDSKLVELHAKQQWATMGLCRKYMRELAIARKFTYKQKKNDNLIIHLICKDPKCKWRVYVRKLPHELTAILRSFNPNHTCKTDSKGRNPMAHAGWVANKIEQDIRNHRQFKPKDLQEEMWEKEGVRISYHTAYVSRLICHERIYGSYAEGYRMVPEIARQVQLKNPGSISMWLRNPYDHSFVSLIVSFKASLDGFIDGCRPLLGLDGSFLKGKYGGCVLSVTALDGNNGLFPIGIMVCRSEDYDNWSKFLSALKPHLIKHKCPLTFISDRAKGLRAAVAEVFPDSYHRFCFRHMYKNFKAADASHKGVQMENSTWGAAKAYRKEDHAKWMAQIKKDDKENTAIPYLESESFVGWSRSYFDTTCKAEHITNNFSESFNKMILPLRDMPITKLVEKYQLLVMGVLYDRRISAERMDPDGVVSRLEQAVAKLKKKYNKYTTAGSTDFLHVVTNKAENSWTVDLEAMTCTCCEWQIKGIPCVHAIAVMLPMRADWRRYCSDFFTVNAYKEAYKGHVIPLEDSNYWPEPQHKVTPPPLNRPPGRPKTNRIPGVDEPAKRKGKRKCTKCRGVGHNKKTCKGAPATSVTSNQRNASEGPSNAQTTGQQPNRPPLIVPSAPVPRTSKTLGKKRASNTSSGAAAKKKRVYFKPPGPSAGL